MECASFLNDEKILNIEVGIGEVEGALRAMKLGRSGGGHGLDPEHIYYGGDRLKLWLLQLVTKSFNKQM